MPSDSVGCMEYRCFAVTKPSTESPRNSKRSLLEMPSALFSFAYELWVSAFFKSSLFLKV